MFSGDKLFNKGVLSAAANKIVAAATAQAEPTASFTVVLCLGHPQAPRGKQVGEVADKLSAMIRAARPTAQVDQVARPDNETTCPAGLRLEWRTVENVAWLAAVLWSEGEGSVTKPDGKRVPVKPGLALVAGDQLELGATGRARLLTPGQALLSLAPSTKLVVVAPQPESKRARFVLASGRLWARARADNDKMAGFDIETASAVVGSDHGTLRLVQQDENRSRVETLTGTASITAGTTSVVVEPKMSFSIEGAAITGPTEQPAAPQKLTPVAGAHKVGAILTWAPVEGAADYQIELAADVQFLRPVFEGHTSATALAIPALPSGKYYWRVLAADAAGVQSAPSPLFGLQIEAQP
jgi:hypothetical protein